ncbi:MAG: hypothetical protein KJ077_05285 [Anaerolineae bacterium]|nr:hypothetical protein [Anaerolineae bacterium]
MNDPQSSLPPESPGPQGTSGPVKVGVYETPERRSGLSPLLIGVIAVLIIAILVAVLAFQFIF